MIATGGTIASKSGKNGLSPALTTDEILSFVNVGDFCDVNAVQLMNIDSTNVTPARWLEIAAAIRNNYDDYDGVHRRGSFVPHTKKSETDSYNRLAKTDRFRRDGREDQSLRRLFIRRG